MRAVSQPRIRCGPRRERRVAVRRLRFLLLLVIVCMGVAVGFDRPAVWALFLVPFLVGTLSFFELGAVLVTGAAALSSFVRLLIDQQLTTDAAADGLIATALFAAAGLLLGRYLRRQRRRESLLAADSLSDRLTGLYNYGTFADLLGREMSLAGRYGGQVTLIMLDLDYFKLFNDRYGHEAGNRLLHGLGGLLRELVRGADVAARYGGEEFAVLIRGDEQDGLQLAERIRLAVSELRVPVGAEQASVTISAGVASYPDGAADASDLVECADAALYVSKQAGRDLVTGHSLGLPQRRWEHPLAASAKRRLRAVAG